MNYVWVVDHPPFPSLPAITQYVALYELLGGYKVSECGQAVDVYASPTRSIYTRLDDAEQCWRHALKAARNRLDLLDGQVTDHLIIGPRVVEVPPAQDGLPISRWSGGWAV